MKPEIIIMLTHHDVTVKDAGEIFEQCKDLPVKFWGFKNVGLPKDEMKKVAGAMKALSCVRDAFSPTKPFCARRMRSSRESISPSSRTKTANFRRMSPIFGDLKSFCTRCASGYRRRQRKCEAEKPMRFRSFTTAACRADTASCVCFAEIPTGGANTDGAQRRNAGKTVKVKILTRKMCISHGDSHFFQLFYLVPKIRSPASPRPGTM